jgi:hypothetical protein
LKPTLTVTKSGKPDNFLADAIKGIANSRAYVGIPEKNTSRKGEITNAGLLYIHTNGSEVMNIPARPVIEPAIEDDRNVLERMLGGVAESALDGQKDMMRQKLEQVGRRGANDAQRWFTNPKNGWPRNKSATIARKLSTLHGDVKKDAMAALVEAGETGDVSNIDTPLIDTGEMRRAITYVTEIKE